MYVICRCFSRLFFFSLSLVVRGRCSSLLLHSLPADASSVFPHIFHDIVLAPSPQSSPPLHLHSAHSVPHGSLITSHNVSKPLLSPFPGLPRYFSRPLSGNFNVRHYHFMLLRIHKNTFQAIAGSLAAMIGAGVLCKSLPYEPGFGPKQMAWILHSSVVGAVIAPMCLLGGPLLVRAAWYVKLLYFLLSIQMQSKDFCVYLNIHRS